MPTKTDRILSYLPGTFRALPRPTALYALVDAFGNELLLAENSLAAVMQAHWVDHADRGAEVIDDLACLAALYGLAPRADESVEEFREHLKRYVRTFLEGTVTVQGILRVTAETLGLRIADDYEEMDTWWARSNGELVTVEPRGDDAAELILGLRAATAAGSPARPAQVMGSVDLGGGVDLREVTSVRLKVDDGGPVEINLAEGAADRAAVTLDELVAAINTGLDIAAARHDDRYLTLASPTSGPTSRLEVQDVANDAAERILGLAPWIYHGSEALAAQVAGQHDLSGGVDLSQERYLRLVIDGTHLAEIDLPAAAADPGAVTLDELVHAINSGLGIAVASHDGHFLMLTSPTTGFQSTIAFQRPAAQDAMARIFGAVTPFHTGRDAQPARVTGRRDLSGGVDLSERANIQLTIDGGEPVTINCAGADPANTRPAEVIAAINAALDAEVASHNGRFVTVTSPTEGPAGEVLFEAPPADDATHDIFGIGHRTFAGTTATAARLSGERDLGGGVDLRARHFLNLAVDGGPPAEIDLRAGAANRRAVTLDELTTAINNALGADVAAHDGQHLILISPTTGGASRLEIELLETTRRRRFVTRAMVTDEATQAVFGFVAREARGIPATSARVVGQADLGRGVDLREAHYLRLAVDDRPAVDIDCAGKRPRATLIDEVVGKINAALGMDIAAHDGRRLVLISPSSGVGSRIAFEPPQATDALEGLLDVEPGTFRGRDATRVSFVGTVDLSAGADLEANAAIKLGIDGAEPVKPVEITLGDSEPSHKTLNQLVIAINLKLNQELGVTNVASHDGTHLILTSPEIGTASQISFAIPDGPDATAAVFGIIPPRAYRGSDPMPARVVGRQDLSGGVDLRVARFLRLAVNGRPVVEVDCASGAADPAAAVLEEIVPALNQALGLEAASHDGNHLILKSPTAGLAGRITLEHHTSGDARQTLLGAVEDVAEGSAPAPAVITGEVDLLTLVDLSQRRWIRLAVDSGRPVDIDVAGAAPAATFLDEMVVAMNAVFPGLASATEDDRLQLTSPTAGEGSHLALLPLRHLELIEYPPQPVKTPVQVVQHGDGWPVVNDGAADVFAEAEITAPQGVVGPTLVNETLGWRVRLLTRLAVGERARLWRDAEGGLQAQITAPDSASRPVSGSDILVGPLGAQAWVPFEGTWHLTGDDVEPAALQLNNPLAPSLVRLHARRGGTEGHAIAVAVTESDLAGPHPHPARAPQAGEGRGGSADGSPARLVGRVRAEGGAYRLVDADEATIAYLRAGPDVDLAAHQDRVVAVAGPLHAGEPPLLIVQHIADLFDVTLRFTPEEGDPVEEHYSSVTIGIPDSPLTTHLSSLVTRHSLVWQINAGPEFSQLVKAEELDKGTVLTLPRGRSDWRYLDCYSSRFNQSRFNSAHFAGGLCYDRGVFNVSRFAYVPPEPVAAVFASAHPSSDPPTEVVLRWVSHRPGALLVNLPADLPARFGGRFNTARFGQKEEAPELYAGAVTEPPEDENYLVDLINARSTLVEAAIVPLVPLGWEAVQMPFRQPQFLTLGAEDAPARLYLAEEGFDGFIELRAREAGAWGDEIAVTARPSGPAMHDVAIIYQGSRFENARQVALGQSPPSPPPTCQKGRTKAVAQQAAPGGDLPTLIQDLLKPGTVGVLQAKAAGVRADVSRYRADSIR